MIWSLGQPVEIGGQDYGTCSCIVRDTELERMVHAGSYKYIQVGVNERRIAWGFDFNEEGALVRITGGLQ